MKLKNDIQVKAFLIRNKIPFEKYEGHLQIDETRLGQANMALLSPYEIAENSIIVQKRSYNKPRRIYYAKKPPTSQLLNLEPDPPERAKNAIRREKGNYSNTQWNEL